MAEFDRLLAAAEHEQLSKCLSRALQLAVARKVEPLVVWLRLETLGYVAGNPAMNESVVVPVYRTVSGSWFDEYGRRFLVQDPKLSFVNDTRLREGVRALEGFVGKQGVISIRDDTAEVIKEHLGVEVTVLQFTPHAVEQVLTKIRGELIDRLVANREALDAPTAMPLSRPVRSTRPHLRVFDGDVTMGVAFGSATLGYAASSNAQHDLAFGLYVLAVVWCAIAIGLWLLGLRHAGRE